MTAPACATPDCPRSVEPGAIHCERCYLIEERAGILEYEAGMERHLAEALARRQVEKDSRCPD